MSEMSQIVSGVKLKSKVGKMFDWLILFQK
jgi:hypothetical protein